MGSSRRRTAVLAVLAAIGTMVAGAEPSGAAVAAPPLTGIEALGPVDLRAFDLDVSGREARVLAEPGTVQLLDDGVPVWTVPFEGDGRLDDVALLDDGGVIVTGTYDDQGGAQLGELGFPLGPHRRDAPHAGFTARLGPDGTPAWVATVRGVDASLVSATVVTDADGNSYVGGALDGDTARFDPDGVDLHVTGFGYVASYAPDGALRWVTHVEGPGGTALAAPALAATSDGGLVATSTFDDEVTWLSAGAPVVLPEPAGTRTLLVLRLATDDGAVEWTATAHSDRSVTGGAVDVDADGNAYVGGSFSRTTTMTVTGTSGSATVEGTAHPSAGNGFVARLGPAGEVDWASGFDGTSTIRTSVVADDRRTDRLVVTGGMRGPTTFGTNGNRSVIWPRSDEEPYVAGLDLDGVHQFARRLPIPGPAAPDLEASAERLVLHTVVDEPLTLTAGGQQVPVAAEGPEPVLLDLGVPGTTPLPPRPDRAEVVAATGYLDDDTTLSIDDTAFDDDGAVLVAGRSGWFGMLGDDADDTDGSVAALEADGSVRWATLIDGIVLHPASVAWGLEGDAYVTGSIGGAGQIGAVPIADGDGGRTYFLAHLDDAGTPTWVRTWRNDTDANAWEMGAGGVAVRDDGRVVVGLGLHTTGTVDDGTGGTVEVPVPSGDALVLLTYGPDGVLADVDADLRASVRVGAPQVRLADDGSLRVSTGFGGRLTDGTRALGTNVPHGVLVARYAGGAPDLRWARLVAQGRQVGVAGSAVGPDGATYVGIQNHRPVRIPPSRQVSTRGAVLVRVDTRGRLQWSRVLSSRSPTAAVIAGPVVVSPRGRIAVGVGFEVGLVAEPSAAVSPNGSSRTDLAVVSYDTQGRVRGRLVDGGADHEWVEGLHVRPDGGLTALLTFPTSGSVGTDGPSEQRFLGLGGPAQAILVDYSVGSFRP